MATKADPCRRDATPAFDVPSAGRPCPTCGRGPCPKAYGPEGLRRSAEPIETAPTDGTR